MVRIIHTENGISREYTPGAQGISVGRAARHTIPTQDPRASRDHFKIELAGGKWVVSDLGSRNGTLLNGDLLTGPRDLKTGDRIMIGAALFVYVDDSAPAPAAPAPAPAPAAPAAAPTPTPPARPQPPPPAPAPPATEPPFLFVIEPNQPQKSFLLSTESPFVIGRAPGCNVVLNDEKMSSRHVELTVTAEGVLARDLKSTNGTKMAGVPFESILLKSGMEFTAGAVTFRVSDPRHPAAAPSAVPTAVKASRRPAPILAAVVVAIAVLGGAAALSPTVLRKFLKIAPRVPTDTSNLIAVNPSFEDPAVAGWTIEAKEGKSQVDADTTQARDGGGSLRIRGIDTRDRSTLAAFTPAVPLEPGAAYRLEGWIRASGLEGNAGLRLEWLKGGSVVGVSPSDLWSEGFDWKQISVTAAPPPGADAVRAACVVLGMHGLVWFDAVKMAKTPEKPGGERWNTPWGTLAIDEAAFLRLDSAAGPLLWNGEMRFVPDDDPEHPVPHWAGRRDGDPQSVGTGYSTARKVGRLGTMTLLAVHANEEDSATWKSGIETDGAFELSFAIDPATVAGGLSTRIGDKTETRTADFNDLNCNEIVIGESPAVAFDVPTGIRLEGARLTFRWPKAAEFTLHLRSGASWIEREVLSMTAEANAASKAGTWGKALLILEGLAKRHPSRPEGKAAVAKAEELRQKAAELKKNAERETEMAKKYPSNANTRRALDLVDELERGFEGTEYASAAARLRKELVPDQPKPPDDTPPDVPKPPEKEPIESARKLLAWADDAFAKEEWLKAEIFCRNVIDRFPGTPEEMKAGELLGRVTAGGKAARERDAWIRDSLTRARNLVKNRQADKAIPVFEEVLAKYPDSPLVKGVREEMERIKREGK